LYTVVEQEEEWGGHIR